MVRCGRLTKCDWVAVLLTLARCLSLVGLALIVCVSSLAQEATPLEAARALKVDKQYEAAIEVVAPALESDEPATVREAELLVADCQRYLARYEEAIASYDALLDEPVEDQTMVTALTGLADCLIRTGKLAEADAAIERALDLYPEITDAAYAARGSTFYTRNVAQYYTAVEFARGQLSKLAGSYADDGNPTAALLTHRKLYHEYADHRGAPDIAIKVGDLLREQGSHEWAIPFYLAALDAGGDRCYSREAKLSVNQRYLDAVSQPPPVARTEAALAGLNACVTELAPEQALDETLLSRFGEKWREALAKTYEPFSDDWLDHWRYLADGTSQEPWRSLCLLAISQSFNRDGYYEEALDVADEAQPDGPAADALKQRVSLARAQAYLGLRELAEAGRYAEWAAAGPDRVVASEAMLLRARAAEMSLDMVAARQAYTIASHESVVSWDRRLAEYGVARVDELSACEVVSDSGVSVLPDDRTTRGDWPIGYGYSHHVLCAQNFIVDRAGGAGPRLKYSFHTTDPSERGRLWVTKKEDDDPVALWDPTMRTHKPANWDDHGEQEPIGSGPDLVVDLDVPEGTYVLSLYFVNDYYFYEPNRYYTVSVTDAENRLLVLTDVEHFGGGLYKRFAVTGPTRLEVHIWRNLSLNTLLSGVFLDVMPQPASEPPIPLADELDSSWTLSEALHIRGHHRAAEAAFDRYLARIAQTVDPVLLPEVYDDLGKALVAAAKASKRVAHEVTLRHVMKDGAYRWDRIYAAYFSALEKAHADDAEALVEALQATARQHRSRPTAFVGVAAFERLREVAPEAADDPTTLYRFARALDSSHQPAEAIPVLKRLLEMELEDELRLDATFLLLLAQGNAGADPAEAEATYRTLVEDLEPSENRRRSALYLVATTCFGAKDYAKARHWLEEYEREYGTTTATQSLLKQCNQKG